VQSINQSISGRMTRRRATFPSPPPTGGQPRLSLIYLISLTTPLSPNTNNTFFQSTTKLLTIDPFCASSLIDILPPPANFHTPQPSRFSEQKPRFMSAQIENLKSFGELFARFPSHTWHAGTMKRVG
jgi:hypothetical protein